MIEKKLEEEKMKSEKNLVKLIASYGLSVIDSTILYRKTVYALGYLTKKQIEKMIEDLIAIHNLR